MTALLSGLRWQLGSSWPDPSRAASVSKRQGLLRLSRPNSSSSPLEHRPCSPQPAARPGGSRVWPLGGRPSPQWPAAATQTRHSGKDPEKGGASPRKDSPGPDACLLSPELLRTLHESEMLPPSASCPLGKAGGSHYVTDCVSAMAPCCSGSKPKSWSVSPLPHPLAFLQGKMEHEGLCQMPLPRY